MSNSKTKKIQWIIWKPRKPSGLFGNPKKPIVIVIVIMIMIMIMIVIMIYISLRLGAAAKALLLNYKEIKDSFFISKS